MLKRLLMAGASACLCSTVAMATPTPLIRVPGSCSDQGLTSTDYATFKAKLNLAVATKGNGGQGNNMWATIVAKNGTVCAVAFSGNSLTDQWLASRVISAQKAFTANSLSLGAISTGSAGSHGKFALSTANLYSAVQPGGGFYGLQHSNPVAAAEAYGDKFGEDEAHTATYGTSADPMVGLVIGGINVFGGGLALYSGSARVGGVGVSGDQACTDHMVAWRLRHALNLDLLAAGSITGPAGGTRPDNIIFDITPNPNGGTGISASGFGHPMCINTPDPTTLPAVQ